MAPHRHAEKRKGPTPGWRVIGPGEGLDRNPRCATSGRAGTATGTRAARSSDRQPLATLCATPLDRQLATTRPHPRAESVGPRPLALLRLIGALHGSRGHRLAIEYSRALEAIPEAVFFALCAHAAFAIGGSLLYILAPGHRPRSLFSCPALLQGSRLDLPAQTQPLPAWQQVRARLRAAAGESAYELWLAPLEPLTWDGAVLRLRAPETIHQWVSRRFGRLIEREARRVLDPSLRIEFVTGKRPRTTPARRSFEPPVGVYQAFNPRYSFDQFVIGESNRLAHAAALAVAEMPGQTYNPLFLFASPGLGKTHLLHAIGNYIAVFGVGATVCYTTAEAFTNHFLAALGTRSVERFKQLYRTVDVLLIDDVQFLASKARTEEEFFHTFNALYEAGRQLVLTCDRLPKDLTAVEERLRDRFEAGLVAEIRRPDFQTRRTILGKRVALDGIKVADRTVLDLIAERVTTNVRALEGALIRIVASNSLTSKPIDRDFAAGVLDVIQPQPASDPPSITSVQRAVASQYGLAVEELLSASRAARLAWPRQLAMYLARELTRQPLERIGAEFGGRNHTTVVHACSQVARRAAGDIHVREQLRSLRDAIQAGETDRSC